MKPVGSYAKPVRHNFTNKVSPNLEVTTTYVRILKEIEGREEEEEEKTTHTGTSAEQSFSDLWVKITVVFRSSICCYTLSKMQSRVPNDLGWKLFLR